MIKVLKTLAKLTFAEVVRDKIFYNALVAGFFLMSVGLIAGQLTFVRPERVVQDFGVTILHLTCAFVALLLGSGMIAKEFERRTVFLVLSRPISRFQFLLGKFLGLSLILFVNFILLSGVFACIFKWMGGSFHQTLLHAFALVLVESIFMAAIAFFFSSFTTPSLTVVFGIGVYLIGTNISQVRVMALKAQTAVLQTALDWFAAIFPNFEFFSLGDQVTYELPVSLKYLFFSLIYALVYSLFLLTFAGKLIERKEI